MEHRKSFYKQIYKRRLCKVKIKEKRKGEGIKSIKKTREDKEGEVSGI